MPAWFLLGWSERTDDFVPVALLMDFLNTEEKRNRRLVHLPMGRFGEAVELAKAALFRECYRYPTRKKKPDKLCLSVASDDSSYVTVRFP